MNDNKFKSEVEGVSDGELKQYFEYLNNLRSTGRVNMYGAAPYLREEFPDLDKPTSRKVLNQWFHTDFDDLNNNTEGE